jgi:spore coat protein GerQ
MYNNYNPINNHYYNYVDEYLRGNIGKRVEVHVSFSDSIEWRDSTFKGNIEAVGKDYIVVNSNNQKYIIWSIYIDYIILL